MLTKCVGNTGRLGQRLLRLRLTVGHISKRMLYLDPAPSGNLLLSTQRQFFTQRSGALGLYYFTALTSRYLLPALSLLTITGQAPGAVL